jgi:alkanesulfonate monooxygenase SsuD/methylene tetrahydromethanopterin reductase-like flavin-dependent oxidoreductase (luciferase family)
MTMMQPLPYLARLVPEAGDMRLGLGIVLLALQNPVDVAESVATLDVISNGRLIFGVGLGYRDQEYDAFGIAREERVRRYRENLRLVKALWGDEPVDADLPWCRLRGARLTLRPVQQPHPPIWMAANNDAAVRRAARHADAWLINPHATLETIAGQWLLYEATRAAGGLPMPEERPAIREVFCARSRAEALEMAGPYLGAKYAAYASWGQDKVLPGDESFEKPLAELESGRFILGSPDDCLDALLPWRDELGINHFVLRSHWSGMPVEPALASIRLLHDEVLPVLRGE